jgi:hypothetical protein
MKDRLGRRSFLNIVAMSLGIGVVYEFAPLLASRIEADAITDYFKKAKGEAPANFTFCPVQRSALRLSGSPDPLGTKAFETAVELTNRSGRQFTADPTHDVNSRDVHAQTGCKYSNRSQAASRHQPYVPCRAGKQKIRR